MKSLLTTCRCSAPPDHVWALASDFANASSRIRSISKIEFTTPGPVGQGTRFREWRGRQAVDMEIAEWSPPRSYTLRGHAAGMEFRAQIRCVPDGTGTRLEMETEIRAVTFVGRLLSPLMFLMSKAMSKSCAKDLADLAAAAERGE